MTIEAKQATVHRIEGDGTRCGIEVEPARYDPRGKTAMGTDVDENEVDTGVLVIDVPAVRLTDRARDVTCDDCKGGT